MTREFVMMPEFERQWKRMGLNDTELRELQEALLDNPKTGVVVRGAGGLRKLRIAFPGRGKSGSGRVAYVDFADYETIYLITAYPKNEKDNLTQRERNEIARLITLLEQGLKNREVRK
jgi:hypothetical protein